ncbi:Non-repetitive/WGA-negative nucleoporin C-terminal-domain-containing protein [Boeremia exigua]|uniref:Non-repetitive/WGA-negative nucleoporin C-terminal-domain-containing protein n=1 Tax=Boeremia exigua TaxID=749465 RepID=UPI001E8E0784|nr:Non-repetitive/WGA-negative nucleoporin C-terminal-domain-containing protein [Boeremia exigua]KAH6639371.1 Non-repetitive/WGA-negative nucleoporin C-terminal-domain-containing protein [Boeremia exigua]
MFSPEASLQSARSSLRGNRRRQRDSNGHDQPRRKRSKIAEDGASQITAGSELKTNGSVNANGYAGHDSVENSVVLVEMPVREKKAPPKRTLKEDSVQYLTQNDNYSIRKLPSFPSALTRMPYTASAISSAGLALAFTTDRALVWDYSSATGPTKVVTLPLPFDLKPSDQLPLGAIVRNGPTNDYGVVAVAPSTGRITFWENIDNAEARSLYPQRHQGVDGTVKLYSGETITHLVDIEHAGFILNFSSGRLAQLTLRDSQGRPNVSTTVLNGPNGSSSSLFSLRGLLGGAIRKTVSSVKARPSDTKGQMEVITTTKNGVFQLWDLSWSGQQIFKHEVDVHDEMLSAVQAGSPPELRAQTDIQVLDFAITEQTRTPGLVKCLALVALFGRHTLDYSLLEVDLEASGGTISRSIPIKTFHQEHMPTEPAGTLLVPQPGHTAFIQFPGAVVIASLAQPEESPETQLLADSGKPNLPFQDVVYFREELNVVVCGLSTAATTRKERKATALIFVQGAGILQFTAQPPITDDTNVERLKVTARSKLEQVTFFSSKPGNVLDFSVKSRFSFSEEETAQAALQVSLGIISSSYNHLDKVTSSMDEQFKTRAAALRTLISSLRSDYPELPFLTKWRLLWHAEKLAAAHKLWNWYEAKLQDQQAHPDAYPEKVLMSDIIKAMHERYKTPINPDLGETDPVRQYFLRDIDTIGVLVPWGWNYLRTFYMKEGGKEQPAVMQRLSEGSDVMLVTLETAFKFRQAALESYGLDSSSLEDGILKPGQGYDELPVFWTSSHNIVSSVRSLVDVGRNLAVENYEEGLQETLSQKIAKDNPRMVRIGCQTHIERFQWSLEQADEKSRDNGRVLRDEWNNKVRPEHICGLMELGLATEGMNLAEHYKDMPTLVNLVWDETIWLEKEKAATRSKMEIAESTVKLKKIKERIVRYFDTYGDDWAEAFYLKHIKEGKAAQMFEPEHLNQAALSKFLRSDPSRARLRWINEVSGEKDFEAAAEALFETASKQETNVWCNKVELSMCKLSMLCQKEDKPGQTHVSNPHEPSKAEKIREKNYKIVQDQWEYVTIQGLLYDHLSATFERALDDTVAVDLLMEEYAKGPIEARPAHMTLLREGLENLIHHKVLDPALTIDILTLMNDTSEEEPTSVIQSNEFTFALRVLAANWHSIHRTTRDGLLKLIWKRLCNKDNWAEINNTKDISDATLEEFLSTTHVGRTFRGLTRLIDLDEHNRVVWPKQLTALVGAGGTHGELCVRFPFEDLREPIIKDNLLDDEILQENLDKNRLDPWFKAACRAGKLACAKEKEDMRQGSAAKAGRVDEEALDEAFHEDEPSILDGGDIVNGADQDQDQEMQGS